MTSLTALADPTTSGGQQPPWAASGVITRPSLRSARIGPPAASVYALEPAGVATMTPSPAYRTKSWSSTWISTITWLAPRRTTTRSLIATRPRPPSPVMCRPGRRRARQRPAAIASSASSRSSAATAVSAPRLPHATPSTGRPTLAASWSACSVVPSPPTPSTTSHDATSPGSATTRSWPETSICTTSAPLASAHARAASRAVSILRFGWTTSPRRWRRIAGAGSAAGGVVASFEVVTAHIVAQGAHGPPCRAPLRTSTAIDLIDASVRVALVPTSSTGAPRRSGRRAESRRPGRPPGPDPRRPERLEQILAAACRAILERGFPATRIADIARAAGVSTGTVHYYFATKDEVLVAALKWASAHTRAPRPPVRARRAPRRRDRHGPARPPARRVRPAPGPRPRRVRAVD